jgi:hypothetical protein
MHPLNKKHFGPETSKLPVRFWNGNSIVNGYVIQQVGSSRFVVTDGLRIKRVDLARTTVLAQYCNGVGTPPNSDYSLIDGLATIVATRSGTHYIWKLTSKKAYTTDGLGDRWAIGSAPNGELLISGVATLVLRDLSTSSVNFPVNTNFSVYVRSITPGSALTATSSDGTLLTFNTVTRLVSGKFTTVGTPTITFVETLAGATGSPRTSTYQVNVNATDALQVITLDPDIATEDRAYFGASMGKTAGSTLTATADDGTVLNVYGGMVVGVFNDPGTKTVTLTEVLGSQTRISTETITVS